MLLKLAQPSLYDYVDANAADKVQARGSIYA